MFPVEMDAGMRAWLMALLVAWAALLFGGFVFGRLNAERTRRMPVWTRIGSSLALVVAGWSWAWLARGSAAVAFVVLIAAGMTLGFLGDLCMARLLPLREYVLGGIGSFGLGHVAYIGAILAFAAGHPHGASFWIAWLIWLVVSAVAWYLVVWRGRPHTTLHRAALPYALLLASTVGFASGLALQVPGLATLPLGAALFLFSDLLLAAHLFNGIHFYLIDDVVWLTYGPGQMLIVYAIGRTLTA